MKIPCEITVFHVLPCIRKELAWELVKKHRYSQTEVARILGVTEAAVSHYMHSKRGLSSTIQSSGKYGEFKGEVERSARRLIEGSDIVTETCLICKVIKGSCAMDEMYKTHGLIKTPVRGYEK